jgi:hypothetical protein
LSTYLPKSTSFVPAGTDLGVKLLKAGADIEIGRNMGIVHVCPNIGEITGELRGTWVDAHQVAAII